MDNTSLELDHIRLFSFQLLRAVNFIHSAHIIHRDIQMSNVFINVDTLMLKVNYHVLVAHDREIHGLIGKFLDW